MDHHLVPPIGATSVADSPGPNNAKVRGALESIVAAAAQRVSQCEGMQACARMTQDWQNSAVQMFFLCGAYQELTGQRQACTREIAASCLTDGAMGRLRDHCLNEFFFWSVVGEAAKIAETLPLTEGDIACAGERIAEQQRKIFVRHAGGISETEYSGDMTPWHIRNALEHGYLPNSDSHHDPALAAGILMVRMNKAELQLRGRPKQQTMDLIFNPLFAAMASKRPTGRHNG
jgi:hypothetical protein